MVFGSILNWVVGRSLDFTVNSAFWITQKTVYGIYCIGYYLIKKKPNNNTNDNTNTNNEFEIIFLTKNELNILYEQNKLLKTEIDLLKKKEIIIENENIIKNENIIENKNIIENENIIKNENIIE